MRSGDYGNRRLTDAGFAICAWNRGAVPVADGAQNALVYRLAPAMKVETM